MSVYSFQPAKLLICSMQKDMGEVSGEDDLYTKDGTVDYRNNPAKKTETGSWKACPFILGTHARHSKFFFPFSFSSF